MAKKKSCLRCLLTGKFCWFRKGAALFRPFSEGIKHFFKKHKFCYLFSADSPKRIRRELERRDKRNV